MGLDVYIFRVKRKEVLMNGIDKTLDRKFEKMQMYCTHLLDRFDYFHDSKNSAYFRKVNFLFAFFQKILVNREFCIVNKDTIEYLIEICEGVLKHKYNVLYAMRNLPTQEGCFFGNTEYNNDYWENVKDCVCEMKKLLKTAQNEDVFIWYFSY